MLEVTKLPAASDAKTESSLLSRSNLLIATIQKLSRTRSIQEIADVVRHAARQLVNADGATFVLRQGDFCYYAAEDAIEPLWEGKKFPLDSCISGWVMNHKRQVAIPEIYDDQRIPHAAYRPTFVKSLVMTPIRKDDPVAAIGTYWSYNHVASEEDLEQLQALADSTSLAIENVNLYNELETRVEERTKQLHSANKELESFAHAVSHDLRTPLIGIGSLLEVMLDDPTQTFPLNYREYLEVIQGESKRASLLVSDMLRLCKISHLELARTSLNFSELATTIFSRLQKDYERAIKIDIKKNIKVNADQGLLTIALENLISNACKYSSKIAEPAIEIGEAEQTDDTHNGFQILYVKDNGAGFDMKYAASLFAVFKRLHLDSDYPGNGLGLATVQRVIHKHSGTVWAESAPGEGACFSFSLPIA